MQELVDATIINTGSNNLHANISITVDSKLRNKASINQVSIEWYKSGYQNGKY